MLLSYIPKKSKEIYSKIIAHRGLHVIYPENTIPAYIEAINKGFGIEIDIRKTKDNKIICLHDRYANRLLGIKGKVSKMTYKKILKYKIEKSDFKVPTLEQVLKLVNGQTFILIEVKGYFNSKFEKILKKQLNSYGGVVYFHAKNIFTYLKLQKIWKDKVFWILNPFRRRFNFIKRKQYKLVKGM